jgi:glycosyltransferase involved in cell wall biosynthesis
MLAILSTHPIQYQVPLWQALAKDGRIPFEVWYLSDHGTRESFDTQFKKSFAWDLDMLSGYPSRFIKVNKNHDVARFSQLRLAEPLGGLMREKNVKALWIQGWQVAAYWQAVWQASAAGVPVWLRGESNDLAQATLWKEPIKRLALGQLFRRVKQFLFIGSANRRFYENYGVRPEQLHAAPYCVDNERFAKAADELRSQRQEIRRGWKIPEDAFCILFAGKFISKKRPMDVVKAATNLKQISPKKIHLLFAGSGELGDQVRSACRVIYDAEKEATAPQNVLHDDGLPPASFVGFLNQSEIPKAYAAADCIVLPSDAGETWGLVINEAMASGLPCVVSQMCGCGEDLVEPIDPKLRFELGDIDGIVASLVQVIDRPSYATAVRNQVDQFNFSASVNTLRRLYNGAGA